MMMRRALVAAIVTLQFGSTSLFAQAGGIGVPTPAIAATSALGTLPGSPVPQTGIPLGATELALPGLSPLVGTMAGMNGFGATCTAMTGQLPGSSGTGTSGSGMSGSSTFDGGGLSMGAGASSLGSAQICSTGSGAGASAPPSPLVSGGVARTGIPLGSVEIGNAGVSPLVVVPTPASSTPASPTLLPSTTMGNPGSLSPTTGMPCGTIGAGC
jgi:hypothetical protein